MILSAFVGLVFRDVKSYLRAPCAGQAVRADRACGRGAAVQARSAEGDGRVQQGAHHLPHEQPHEQGAEALTSVNLRSARLLNMFS